jgi:hypothetical protein
MVIFAVDFPRSRRPAVIEHKLAQLGCVFGIKVAECGVQRPFADAGGAGEYDEASHKEKRIQKFKNSRTREVKNSRMVRCGARREIVGSS